jgi:glycosyltransferase involved in cell wall biosynthesis
MPELSIVIPAYNERENLGPLLAELHRALERIGRSHEIVLVDDGSRDGSAEWLRAESQRDPSLVPVLLERNSGQSAALAAGLAHARGDVIVTLDADLQNDPADLPRVLEALDGADVVSGIRAHRQDGGLRLLSSRIANAVRRGAIGDPITDIGCSFKAYRRTALEGLPMFVGVHRFLPALCVFRGASSSRSSCHIGHGASAPPSTVSRTAVAWALRSRRRALAQVAIDSPDLTLKRRRRRARLSERPFHPIAKQPHGLLHGRVGNIAKEFGIPCR